MCLHYESNKKKIYTNPKTKQKISIYLSYWVVLFTLPEKINFQTVQGHWRSLENFLNDQQKKNILLNYTIKTLTSVILDNMNWEGVKIDITTNPVKM